MPRRRAKTDTSAHCKPSPRDYVMARLAAARAQASSALADLDDAIGHFVDPEDDCRDGDLRSAAMEAALESLGCASRCIEAAQEVWDDDDLVDPGEGEDYGDDDDEDEEEDD